jgi:hypothetical protein
MFLYSLEHACFSMESSLFFIYVLGIELNTAILKYHNFSMAFICLLFRVLFIIEHPLCRVNKLIEGDLFGHERLGTIPVEVSVRVFVQ